MSTTQVPALGFPPAVPVPKPGRISEDDIRSAFSDSFWVFGPNSFVMVLKWLKDECDEAMKFVQSQEGVLLYTGIGATYRRQPESTKKMIFDFMLQNVTVKEQYERSCSRNLMLGMLMATNHGYRQHETDGDSSNNWLVRECTNARLAAWRAKDTKKEDATDGPALQTTSQEQVSPRDIIVPGISTIHHVLNNP
ncbi:hypothetical protein EYR41_006105 [Orbilia oligospora]|uniref:Uncharacterized protein n=1 Tax=Orbilia oligospora TaxID=2813651 RepID=A0A8H2DZZ3_ORBOL|nr:hypothetical protein EYR41_006105 [Orbilia oligospora]